LGDWLGTGHRKGGWRPFKAARAFARRLKLKNGKEWFVYAKSKEKPDDIPKSPNSAYAEVGWAGWSDWLGTERAWRIFKDARAFVRGLKLKSQEDWKTYAKSRKKPQDIPSHPETVYANTGWVNWGDWLGTGQGPGWPLRAASSSKVTRTGRPTASRKKRPATS
jgi:hypothetical protein